MAAKPRSPSSAPRLRKRDLWGPKYAIERQIFRVAGRQLHLIKTEELLDAGVPPRQVSRWAAGGRLFRMQHGVYATHPPPYSLEQRWLASVLACGEGALLSDWPGAIHLDIAPRRFPTRTHVTVPPGRARSRRGIIVHQRRLEPRDGMVKDGIPVTRPELVLIHLSPALSPVELEQMLVAAESLRILDRRRLAELVEERGGRPGIHKLVPLLGKEPSIAKSELELLMVPVLHEAGVPWPRFNDPVRVPERERPLIVDLHWPELGMVVELDSQRWHGDWERAEEDRERAQLVALAGLAPHRLFRRQVKREPAVAADRLRRLVDLRRRELAQQRPSSAASSRIDEAA